MKIKITKKAWMQAGKKAGLIKESRRKDSHDRPLAYVEDYILKKRVHKIDDPYFLGGGTFHAPVMVFDPKEASIISGGKLEDMAWDWTRDWMAIPVKTPSPAVVVFGLKHKDKASDKKAYKIPNTQNNDPDQEHFAVELGGKTKTLPNGIKSRANKEIHALGNYFSQIPLNQILDILKKYNIILLQEDGTLWDGFVTSQGECGSDRANKNGPMKFELAFKYDTEYILANNILLMTACEMPSGRLEVISYIS